MEVDVKGKFITQAHTNTGNYTDKKFATNTDKSDIIQITQHAKFISHRFST